jgi:hypothetical protein
MNCIHLSFSDWSSPRVFSFTNAASLIKQFVPLVNRHFCWWYPSKHLRNLLFTVTTDVDSWNHSTHLALSTWNAILTGVSVALQVERFGNSGGTNYKLDHITYWNAFCFHSSTFRFFIDMVIIFNCTFKDSFSLILIYREFRERRTRLTLLLSASACEMLASSAKENYCRLVLDMPCIVNMYVHFWK